jgi:hypothetical protein
MPFPYTAIPTLDVWQKDSSAVLSVRASDPVLQVIDSLVAASHRVGMQEIRQETLFYLRQALKFWLKKVNVVPANQAPEGLSSTNLPKTAKFSGREGRTDAISALLSIVNDGLRDLLHVASDPMLAIRLNELYGADNHGVASDQQWLHKHADVSVFLTTEATQRKYKLRFREGVAWRWVDTGYVRFDSTDNRESESNDQMVHFVMDQRGRIYAGFDKDAVWFKHSSLVGGQNAHAAGRMKLQSGLVTFVENDSGHYQPAHQQMRNLLRRLQLYGAPLTGTTVRRISDKKTFAATEMLANQGAWPDGYTGY